MARYNSFRLFHIMGRLISLILNQTLNLSTQGGGGGGGEELVFHTSLFSSLERVKPAHNMPSFPLPTMEPMK